MATTSSVLQFNRFPGSQQINVLSEKTLHNGNYWYCFDKPNCQKVVYYSTSGTFMNKWVYSLNGLNGSNIVSSLDNFSNNEPVSTSTSLWQNTGSEGINSSQSIGNLVVSTPNSQTCLNNDFYECYGNLVNYFTTAQLDTILDIGIVESGNIGNLSSICKIKNILLELKPNFTSTDVYNYLMVILEKGIVISKNPNGFSGTIKTVDKF